VTTPAPVRTPRGRRSARPSGDDREQAILATAERLLRERNFADIAVDDLARGAGLSRPAFYFYFPSKDAVLVTLFERVLTEADATMRRPGETSTDDPASSWRDGIYAFFASFRAHQAVTLAGLAATATNPEIREVWSTFSAKWVADVALLIEAERDRGAAPVTIPAEHLSATLNLMNERVMVASFAGGLPVLPEDAALDALAHVWVTAIYGQAP
jgi:TetR/AcrR family transcriptional regulator, ethionamide resistance regulator